MALKAQLPSLDGVPADVAKEYEKSGDSFVLRIEGTPQGFIAEKDLAEANGKVGQFRDLNLSLVGVLRDELGLDIPKETAAPEIPALIRTKYRGIKIPELQGHIAKVKEKLGDDIEKVVTELSEYRELKEKAEELDGGKGKGSVKNAADLNAAIQRGIEAAMTPLKNELATVKGQLTATEKANADAAVALKRKDFEAELTRISASAGADTKMLPAFVKIASDVWRLEGDAFKAYNGATPMYDSKGEPLTLKDWVTSQMQELPGFFKTSSGGGTTPTVLPVGVRELVNPTPEQLGSKEVGDQVAAGKLRIVHR